MAPKISEYDIFNMCITGNMDRINPIISNGVTKNDYDWGLAGACMGGHVDIVKLMMDEGGNNWGLALLYACMGGHINLVKLMMSKGEIGTVYLGQSLHYACIHGHTEIIDMFVSRGGVIRNKYDFPHKNKKTKFYHNDIYYKDTHYKFMHNSILFWAIAHNKRSKKKRLIQGDLIPSVLKLMYF